MPTKKQDIASIKESLSALSFENAMKRLEEIAEKLESSQVSLDDSLALYEEGIALVRHCTDRLDTAEQKIRTLDPSSLPIDSE